MSYLFLRRTRQQKRKRKKEIKQNKKNILRMLNIADRPSKLYTGCA